MKQIKHENLNLVQVLSRSVEKSLLKALFLFSLLGILGTILLQLNQAQEDFKTIAQGLNSGILTDLQNNDKWTTDSRLLSQVNVDGIIEIAVFKPNGERFSSVQRPPGSLQINFPMVRKLEIAIAGSFDHPLISDSNKKWGNLRLIYTPVRALRTSLIAFALLILQILTALWMARRSIESVLRRSTDRLTSLANKVSSLSLDIRDGKDDLVTLLDLPPPDGSVSIEIEQVENAFQNFALEIQTTREKALDGERHRAVALMTQMVAHDVRKPFTMFKAAVDTIRTATNLEEMKSITEVFIPEIDRAMSSVNGLLQDVMEVSSKADPVLENVRPESLIKTTLSELFSIYPTSDISLTYNIQHTAMAYVDLSKITRVFSNIASNAVQAMDGHGELWFKTRDVTQKAEKFIEFTIGNSGSFIEHDCIPHLFHAFFTKGKKGGTGLGLAIAQKIISAHGGSIKCVSERNDKFPNGFVEFEFTVRALGKAPSIDADELPKHSKEINLGILKNNQPLENDSSRNQIETSLGKRISAFGRALQICILDDEKIYRNAIKAYISKFDVLKNHVNLIEFSSSDELNSFLISSTSKIDGAILDIDLGFDALNGFQISEKLRMKFPFAFLCVHSNRTFADDHKRSIESGADAFLPKPMSKSHFLNFVSHVLERQESSQQEIKLKTSEKVLFYAFVDDSDLIRLSWSKKLKGEYLDVFKSPEQFFSKCQTEHNYLDNLGFAVTDFHFGESSKETGETFAKNLKRLRPELPIFLASDGEFDTQTTALFYKSVEKLPPTQEIFARWKKEMSER